MKVDLFSLRYVSTIQHMSIISNYGIMVSENQLKSEEMQRLLKSDSTFDLILSQGFVSESISAGLAHRFKAPSIAFMTFQPSLWCNYFVSSENLSSLLNRDRRRSFVLGRYTYFTSRSSHFLSSFTCRLGTKHLRLISQIRSSDTHKKCHFSNVFTTLLS